MFTGTAASSESYSIYDYPQIGRRAPTVEATKWWCTNIEVAPNCPRCASTNTKFCYYNNYSLSQPRYFCKACRRYWTKGGSLRNVPVGGGCRKSRRARSSRTGPNPAHTPASGPDAPPESGPCIDMAAVFAKYVSPSMEGGEDPSFSPRPSSGSSENYSQIEDGAIFECHRDQVAAVDGLIDSGDTDQVPGQFFPGQDMDGGDFSCQGFGPIGMQQGVIPDDVAPDVLWSSEVTGSPDFGAEVQPDMPVPDFGLFSGEDPFRISGNLMAENWAPFDLSAYELFSNP